jgi:hypothetical protein
MRKSTDELIAEMHTAFRNWFWMDTCPTQLRQGSSHWYENCEPVTDPKRIDELDRIHRDKEETSTKDRPAGSNSY